MASHPPGRCCTSGTLHIGEPKGELIKAADGYTDAYLAKATGDNAKTGYGLLYIPDAIGIYSNSKLMADSFAAQGYTTLLLDIFNGDPIPLNRPGSFDLYAWIREGTKGDNPHTVKEIDPLIVTGIETLRAQGVEHIGAVAYCFGAKYLVRHYKSGIKVGFCGHPSLVEEDELAAIGGPLSIAAAEEDKIFTVEKRHKSEEILRETKQPYQMTLYSGTEHGFAARGSLQDKLTRFAKERAFEQAIVWFEEFLGNQ